MKTFFRSVVTGLAAVAGLALPAHAQQDTTCFILCSPKIVMQPGVVVTNLFDPASVRMLQQAGTPVVELERETNFVMVLAATIPTEIPRLSLYTQLLWTPFAERDANPFTEYSADELEEEAIRANALVYETGIDFTLLQKQQTNGWLSASVQAADQIGPAAEPDDEATYTHKLQLSANANWGVFQWLPEGNWLRNVDVYTTLDYVATGLADEGDEVPDDEQLYLSDAAPWSYYTGVTIPIAPLDP